MPCTPNLTEGEPTDPESVCGAHPTKSLALSEGEWGWLCTPLLSEMRSNRWAEHTPRDRVLRGEAMNMLLAQSGESPPSAKGGLGVCPNQDVRENRVSRVVRWAVCPHSDDRAMGSRSDHIGGQMAHPARLTPYPWASSRYRVDVSESECPHERSR